MKGETRFPLYYSNISLEHLFHLFAQFDRSTNLIEIRWVFYPFVCISISDNPHSVPVHVRCHSSKDQSATNCQLFEILNSMTIYEENREVSNVNEMFYDQGQKQKTLV
jgi:hypothetical protein